MLEARVAELMTENRRLRGEDDPPQGRSGKLVVPIFVGLILASMGTAFTIWTAARRTALEREARHAAVRPLSSRVDAAGRAAVFGVQQCLAEAPINGEVTVRLRLKIAPAGTAGVLDADVMPKDAEFIQCVRRIPSNLQMPAAPGAEPMGIEIAFRQAPKAMEAGSGYDAGWSWRSVQ
jgi:hypothetical protein